MFYPGGAYGPRGLLAGSVKEIENHQLYPVIRSIAANPDSAARGCLRSTYELLSIDDVQALAPEIVESIETMAPANTMFSKGVRLAGIKAMARLKIEEGIPLTLHMMQLKDWGKGYIIDESINVLKQYRGAAKSIVPDLKKLATELDKKSKQYTSLMDVISLIEKDMDPPSLVKLKTHVKQSR